MLRTRKKLSLFLLLVFAAALIAGCSKPVQDTKAPPVNQIGVIDMDKAIKAHPKYNDYQRLQKELNTLMAQVQTRANQAASNSADSIPALPEGAADGLNAASAQEFNAKMDAKKAEIKARLDAQAAKVRSELSAALDAYTKEVDREYQPKIFNLQLKLKTVQLTKEEMTALQQELDKLQNERSAKIAAKQKDLGADLEARMAPAQESAEQELKAYAEKLNKELSERTAAKMAEMTARSSLAVTPPPTGNVPADLDRQISLKRQEISGLQEFILGDIRDKVAKVAAGKKLEAVLATYKVNVKAVDITDAVIAEFKK